MTLALNLVSANLLGRFAFGEFTVVQGTLSTVGALAQVATGYTATKYVAELRERILNVQVGYFSCAVSCPQGLRSSPRSRSPSARRG